MSTAEAVIFSLSSLARARGFARGAHNPLEKYSFYRLISLIIYEHRNN